MKIGIIGGSGLDDPEILKEPEEKYLTTPYGDPSSPLKIGKISGVDVILLARHGNKHQYPPSKVNYRANIFALKQEGCTHILSTTACGSLRRDIERGDFVILDQFIDFTRHRNITFHDTFTDGAKHTPMALPFNEELRKLLIETSNSLGYKTYDKGTVVTIEGPRFSTKAESKMFRAWGADVINMSIAPEVILANEMNIPYATVAMSTDFDCLFEDIESVKWDDIIKVFNQNSERVKQLLISTIEKMANKDEVFIKSKIRAIPNFPKEGIIYRDITTLLKDREGFEKVIGLFCKRYKDKEIDIVAGIESRGFIIGGVLANELSAGFVPIRKIGKLPHETIREDYQLEYGTDSVEIHKDSILPGQKVLLIDDLIATGGTALAACKLIEKLGGEIVECGFIIDLPDLKGREKLSKWNTFAIVSFEDE